MTAKLGQEYKMGEIAGSTHQNAGNWVVEFSPADMNVALPVYECYRIVIKGGPPGSTFDVYIDNNLYDSVAPGDTNSWDPNNPMKLEHGNKLSFWWNVGSPDYLSYQPTVWLYFQVESPL